MVRDMRYLSAAIIFASCIAGAVVLQLHDRLTAWLGALLVVGAVLGLGAFAMAAAVEMDKRQTSS